MLNDGTGIIPSINSSNADVVLDYIVSKTGAKSALDIGTGLGYLVEAARKRDFALFVEMFS